MIDFREEAEFAKNYRDSMDSLFKDVALSKMPGSSRFQLKSH